eukprot:6211741-Pleurochrysis_carterae.AAC.5
MRTLDWRVTTTKPLRVNTDAGAPRMKALGVTQQRQRSNDHGGLIAARQCEERLRLAMRCDAQPLGGQNQAEGWRSRHASAHAPALTS